MLDTSTIVLVLVILAFAVLYAFVGWWAILAFGLLLVGLVIFGFLFMVLSLIQVYWQNWLAPRQEAEAAVVRKEVKEYDYEALTEMMPAASYAGGQVSVIIALAMAIVREVLIRDQYVYWATFSVNDEELDFRVPEWLYLNLQEGDQGVLAFKGERFLHFRTGAHRPAAAPRPDAEHVPVPRVPEALDERNWREM